MPLPRSGLTIQNALRWKHFFDAAIASNKEQLLQFKQPSEPGYLAEATVKNRISDGLKWLCEHNLAELIEGNSEEEKQGLTIYSQLDYQQLKDKISINHIEGKGILIKFDGKKQLYKNATALASSSNHGKSNLTGGYEVVTIDRQAIDNWREDLIKYIEDPARTDMYFKSGLALSTKDIEIAERICSGLVTKITSNSITVVK